MDVRTLGFSSTTVASANLTSGLLGFLMGLCAAFILFTVAVQMLVGMSTGQNFLDIPWTGSMFIGGIIALAGAVYESLEV